jgi:hypothetical protein
MTQTLIRTEMPRIVKIDPFYQDGSWWVEITYSDGGDDVHGPFDSREKAEGVIF